MVLIQISLIMDLTFQFLSWFCWYWLSLQLLNNCIVSKWHFATCCDWDVVFRAAEEMKDSTLDFYSSKIFIPCVCSVYIWRELLLIVDQDYINPGKALIISSGPDMDWVIPGPQDSTNQKASIGGLQISTAYQFSSIHPFILWRPNLTLL